MLHVRWAPRLLLPWLVHDIAFRKGMGEGHVIPSHTFFLVKPPHYCQTTGARLAPATITY